MLIGHIEGATRLLGKDQPEYITLPIRDEATEFGNVMKSAWFPTPAEIELIKAGQPVILSICGNAHPPVMLEVK